MRLGLAHPALNGCRDLGHLMDHQTIKDRACGKTKLIDLSSKLIALSFEMPGKSHFTFLDCLSTYETVTNVGNRNPFSCSKYSCYQNSWQKSSKIPPPWSLLLAFGPHGSVKSCRWAFLLKQIVEKNMYKGTRIGMSSQIFHPPNWCH